MDQQDTIALYAKLEAYEILIQQMLVMVAKSRPNPRSELEAYRQRLLSDASTRTFPTVPAEMSDHLSGEVETVLDRLVSAALEALSEPS